MPHGGAREGAGRRNLYRGKPVRKSVTLTEQAVDRGEAIQRWLQAQHPDATVSFSDAVEWAIEQASEKVGERWPTGKHRETPTRVK